MKQNALKHTIRTPDHSPHKAVKKSSTFQQVLLKRVESGIKMQSEQRTKNRFTTLKAVNSCQNGHKKSAPTLLKPPGSSPLKSKKCVPYKEWKAYVHQALRRGDQNSKSTLLIGPDEAFLSEQTIALDVTIIKLENTVTTPKKTPSISKTQNMVWANRSEKDLKTPATEASGWENSILQEMEEYT